MREGLSDCDIVMMLRLQTERMQGIFVPSIREYFYFYGLTHEKLACARCDALVMHPGPMNRGVEIDSILADDLGRNLVHDQVETGVAVRMSCLELLTGKVLAMKQTLIENAQLVDPVRKQESEKQPLGALLIEDGKIKAHGDAALGEATNDALRIDAQGGCLRLGLWICASSCARPGEEHKETIVSAVAAAAAAA